MKENKEINQELLLENLAQKAPYWRHVFLVVGLTVLPLTSLVCKTFNIHAVTVISLFSLVVLVALFSYHVAVFWYQIIENMRAPTAQAISIRKKMEKYSRSHGVLMSLGIMLMYGMAFILTKEIAKTDLLLNSIFWKSTLAACVGANVLTNLITVVGAEKASNKETLFHAVFFSMYIMACYKIFG